MPIERGSTAHGPHLDEQMEREVQGRTQGRVSPRAQPWHEPEPAGEDQPEPDRLPEQGHTASGIPVGMAPEDVEGRSRLAKYLPYRQFPADRARLLETAARQNSPDDVLAELRRLPDDVVYQTVSDVWDALGHGREDDTHRA